MGIIKIKVKTSLGDIIIQGESHQEVEMMLEKIPPDFIEKIKVLLSQKLISQSTNKLKGIVELTVNGPILTTRKKLTHYEAIGLILYASEEGKQQASQIKKLLESSGLKTIIHARLNEMTKRGHVFKPKSNKPEFKLTNQGENWIEKDVLKKLQEIF